MKIVARKDLMCLVLASLSDNKELYLKHLREIVDELGLDTVLNRCRKLNDRGYIVGKSIYRYSLTEKGKKLLDETNN